MCSVCVVCVMVCVMVCVVYVVMCVVCCVLWCVCMCVCYGVYVCVCMCVCYGVCVRCFGGTECGVLINFSLELDSSTGIPSSTTTDGMRFCGCVL